MKLPLIFFLTSSYIAGVLIASSFTIPLSLILALLLTTALLILLFRRRYLVLLALLLSGFVLLGALMAGLVDFTLKESALLRLAGNKPLTVTGVVSSEPRRAGRGSTFTFRVNSAEVDGKSFKVNERLKVVVRDEGKKIRADYGRALKITGRLVLPRTGASEGFDYRKYLYRQRILLILQVSSPDVEPEEMKNLLGKAIVSTRDLIKRQVHRSLRGDSAGLMLGVFLGDTSDISLELQEDFSKTGLTHILAVSGLNVAMLLGVLLLVLRALKCRPWLQLALATSFIGFYALLTRGEPSVLRAAVMAVIGLGGWYLGKQRNMLSAVSSAALLLLVYDPFLLYSVSFQLSFAATLALVVFCPILGERLEEVRVPPWLREGLTVTLAAQLGVLPILAFYFNQVSLISVLANLIVVPATAPLLAAGLAASTLGWISGSLSHLVYLFCSLVLSYIIKITHVLAQIPWAALEVPSPSAFSASLYYVALGVAMHGLSLKKRSWDRRILLLLLLVVAVVVWFQVIGSSPPSRLQATFFAVGQGDAALIRSPEGINILIDGGENSSFLRKALVRKRVGRLDLVILSHPHADHVGGLKEVVANKKVGMVLDAGQVHPTPLYRDFLKTVRKRGIPYKIVRAGMAFQVGDELTLHILHPQQDFVRGSASDLNNNSVVTRLCYKDVSLLFAGDVEREGMQALLSRRKDLKSNVLKVPHHGSENGAGLAFLKAISPQFAVVSVGRGNPFGHPAPSTLKRLRSLGAKVYRTDELGDVTIVTDGREIAVKSKN